MRKYLQNYREAARETAEKNAGEIMTVILSEEFVAASKQQICDYIPEIYDQISGHTNPGSKYDSRTSGGQFKDLEEIALLGHLPKYGTRKMHTPLINPDIRIELIRAATEQWSPFKITGIDETDDVEDFDIDLGPELGATNWMQQIGRELSESMMWYVGRAIENGTLPYSTSSAVQTDEREEQVEEVQSDEAGKGYGGSFSDFGLRTLMFGHLELFCDVLISPEIEFDAFETIKGSISDGYCIAGRLEAKELQLKSGDELSQDEIDLEGISVDQALQDWIRSLLLALFRCATFKPTEGGKPGEGAFDAEGLGRFEDLSDTLTGKYDDPDPADIADDEWSWSLYKFVDYLNKQGTLDVDPQEEANKIEFELNIPPRD